MAERVEVSEAEGDVTAEEPLDELAALDHGASTSLALTLNALLFILVRLTVILCCCCASLDAPLCSSHRPGAAGDSQRDGAYAHLAKLSDPSAWWVAYFRICQWESVYFDAFSDQHSSL